MYKIATKTQRFFALLFDLVIVYMIGSLLASLFVMLFKIDTNLMLDYYNQILEKANSVTTEEELNAFLELYTSFFKIYIPYMLTLYISLIFIGFLYFGLLAGLTSFQTFGRLIMRCRVVPANGEKRTFGQAIVRDFIGSFLFYVIGGVIFALINGIFTLKEAGYWSLNDKMSKSRLIDLREPRVEIEVLDGDGMMAPEKPEEESDDSEYKAI